MLTLKGEMQASVFRNCVNTLTEIKSMRENIEDFFNQEMLQSEVPLWVELNQKSV